jgi:hypothetical protein
MDENKRGGMDVGKSEPGIMSSELRILPSYGREQSLTHNS